MTDPSSCDLSGLWIPIVTPFTSAGELDEASLRQLAERLLAEGATGLVALGTTGEPATLKAEERRQVVEICARACDNANRRLIVGAGTNSTQGTIEEIHALVDDLDVLAVLIVAPYYTRPSPAAVVEHFTTVADASPVPLVVYNIPYRTGVGLNASELLAAAAHPNIIGLKQSVGALDVDTLRLLGSADPGFQVLAGDDAFVLPTLLMGGTGAIAAAAHLCTSQFVAMVDSARRADLRPAVDLANALLPVVTAGFAEPSPAVWKAALAHDRIISCDRVRRPITEASAPARERLLAAAESARALQLLAE